MAAFCHARTAKASDPEQTLPLAIVFAVCKHWFMADMITPTALSAAAGISVPYASQILSKQRVPSRPLAISIYRKTGLRTAPIEGLSDKEIAFLERIDGKAA
jgi:hypothetical protein